MRGDRVEMGTVEETPSSDCVEIVGLSESRVSDQISWNRIMACVDVSITTLGIACSVAELAIVLVSLHFGIVNLLL